MKNSPLVSVIIVNYNGASYIQDCIKSVLLSKTDFSFEIIVVDNASVDNSVEKIVDAGDSITAIFNDENKGFSGGNNQGISIAEGSYIFLLNNDTIIDPDALSKLVKYYEQNKDTGVTGPRLLNRDRTLQVPGSFLGRWQYKGTRPRKVGFISGAAFLTRKDILAKTGGLDENFFFYNEDIDLCMQIKKMGLNLIYMPEAEVVHFGGESTKTRVEGPIIEGYRGGLYLCYKHYNQVFYLIYRCILFIDIILRIIWYAGLYMINRNYKPQLRAFIKIFNINVRNDIFLIYQDKR
ncbi:MAG: glycosyltransferase family 2 protein [bacterium]|nr:glycosyltransferase family 2 protein [bacterium]